MNNITEIIEKCERTKSRYIGDLNLLTLAAFDCKLSDVKDFCCYTESQLEIFFEYVNEFFNSDIPTAYIVGFEYFLNNKILVTPDTLIPRFETEELVLNLIAKIKKRYLKGTKLVISDICCGSGVIGVNLYNALKDEYDLEINFVDISAKALEVTKNNADKYGLKYNLFEGDMAKPLIQNKIKSDIIVSNPPYIDYSELVQDTVAKYEPSLALYANDSGLYFYKSLINDIMKISTKKFCFILEIGESQSQAINDYLNEQLKLKFEVLKDINGSDRNLYLEV